MKAVYTIVIALLSFPLVWCIEPRYTNSTSKPTVTSAPVFCGGCQLIYEVHGHVWWPTIYTDYVATMVYTVDKDSGSTIGSKLQPRSNTTIQFGDGINFTKIAYGRDGGGIQTTYLNSLSNSPFTTVIQENEITMSATDYSKGYALSTQYLNTSRTGTARTQCVRTYFTRNTTTITNLFGLPAITTYTYNTVIPFDSTFNMSNAIQYGIDSLASHVATYLNLTIPACTSNTGGGVGTLKIGVTALTASSTIYTTAQAQVTQPASPPASPTPPIVTPTVPSPPPPPQSTTTAPSPPDQTTPGQSLPAQNSPSASPAAPTPPAGSATVVVIPVPNPTLGAPAVTPAPANPQYYPGSSTIITVIPGPGGDQTISIVVPVGSTQYTKVFAITTTGSDGLSTVSSITTVISLGASLSAPYTFTTGVNGVQSVSLANSNTTPNSGSSGVSTSSKVTTAPIGSYIASFGGISPINQSPTVTSPGTVPTEVAGSRRLAARESLLMLALAVVSLMFTMI